MQILLINPGNSVATGRDLFASDLTTRFLRFNPLAKSYFAVPLALPTLAAVTPREHTVRIIDEAIEAIDFDQPCDLVGLTAMTFKAPRAYEIARVFRARGVPVVMGGIHATMCPDEAARHVDAVVAGEADELWPVIVADAQAGRLQPRFRMDRHPDLGRLPSPRHDLTRYQRYMNIPLQTARGCPFNCTFCTVTKMGGGAPRFKTVDQVLAEVEDAIHLMHARLTSVRLRRRDGSDPRRMCGGLAFVDDNFAIDREHALRVCHALRAYQEQAGIFFFWHTQVNFRAGLDAELLAALQAANCKYLFMGFETIDPHSLRQMKKGMNDPQLYGEVIRNVRRHGMDVICSVILGHDGETPETIAATGQFIEDHDLFFVLPNILTPYPGSDLRQEMEGAQRIISRDHNRYNVRNVVFQPRNITPLDLRQAYVQLCTRVFGFDRLVACGLRVYQPGPDAYTIRSRTRVTICVLFLYTALALGLLGRLRWSVVARIFGRYPRVCTGQGTIEAALMLFAFAADFNDFARSERRRLQRDLRTQHLTPGHTDVPA